jgi:hypothetical protein
LCFGEKQLLRNSSSGLALKVCRQFAVARRSCFPQKAISSFKAAKSFSKTKSFYNLDSPILLEHPTQVQVVSYSGNASSESFRFVLARTF